MNTKRKRLFIAALSTFPAMLFLAAVLWMLRTWKHLRMEELIYELKAPLAGTATGVIHSFLIGALLPAAAGTCAVVLLCAVLLGNGKRKLTSAVMAAGFAGPLLIGAVSLFIRLDVKNYLQYQGEASSFIEDHYIAPDEVEIAFPEKKRNLIYIFLESMEVTYSDFASGGAFEKNVIPELTAMALENECFSGGAYLNGGYAMTGATWTMGGMFAQSAGLPLQVDINGNGMATQDDFFPEIVTMGDILNREGYEQVLMLGSDCVFGGRELYYSQHGNFNIFDYVYAQEKGLIPEDYYEFWGFEDQKLFSYAKEELLRLSSNEKPFHLSMLTVDTHFEDGYVCALCTDDFGDDQYANAMACSSRQVSEFVNWIRRQSFYENTTVMIVGDHLTMDKDFCRNVAADYNRKVYTCVINPAVSKSDPGNRIFNTFDLFPTTLAAMGASISGDRLGLGTNLFSRKETLMEQYGKDVVVEQLRHRSDFLADLGQIDFRTDKMFEAYERKDRDALHVEKTDEEHIRVHVYDIWSSVISNRVDQVFLELTREGEETETYACDRVSPYHYASKEIIPFGNSDIAKLEVYAVDMYGKYYPVLRTSGNLAIMAHQDFALYMNQLAEYEDYCVFLSVKDEASTELTEEMQASLHRMGLKETLRNRYRASYIAVLDRGKVVCEEIDEALIETEGALGEIGTDYKVKSGGFDVGAISEVFINGEDYSRNRRGINVVVYDDVRKEVVDTAVFDTHLDIPELEIDFSPGDHGETPEIRIDHVTWDNWEKVEVIVSDGIAQKKATIKRGAITEKSRMDLSGMNRTGRKAWVVLYTPSDRYFCIVHPVSVRERIRPGELLQLRSGSA